MQRVRLPAALSRLLMSYTDIDPGESAWSVIGTTVLQLLLDEGVDPGESIFSYWGSNDYAKSMIGHTISLSTVRTTAERLFGFVKEEAEWEKRLKKIMAQEPSGAVVYQAMAEGFDLPQSQALIVRWKYPTLVWFCFDAKGVQMAKAVFARGLALGCHGLWPGPHHGEPVPGDRINVAVCRHDLKGSNGMPLYANEAQYLKEVHAWLLHLLHDGYIAYLQLRPETPSRYAVQQLGTTAEPRQAEVESLRKDAPEAICLVISGMELTVTKSDLLAGRVWLPLQRVMIEKESVVLPGMPAGFGHVSSTPPDAKYAVLLASATQDSSHVQLAASFHGTPLGAVGPYGLVLSENGRIGVAQVLFKNLAHSRVGLRALGYNVIIVWPTSSDADLDDSDLEMRNIAVGDIAEVVAGLFDDGGVTVESMPVMTREAMFDFYHEVLAEHERNKSLLTTARRDLTVDRAVHIVSSDGVSLRRPPAEGIKVVVKKGESYFPDVNRSVALRTHELIVKKQTAPMTELQGAIAAASTSGVVANFPRTRSAQLELDFATTGTTPHDAQLAVARAVASGAQVVNVLASFGTGKTMMVGVIAASAAKRGSGQRSVAIACPSNENLSDVSRKLKHFGVQHVLVLPKEQGGLDHYELHSCTVFVADSYHRLASGYEVLVIEESIQLQCVQVLKIVLHQRSLVKVVLLGDEAQLPPVVHSRQFKHTVLFKSSATVFRQAGFLTLPLTCQFRCPEGRVKHIATAAYGYSITSGPLTARGACVRFIASEGKFERVGASSRNTAEAKQVISIYKQMKQMDRRCQVQIVTPFVPQVDALPIVALAKEEGIDLQDKVKTIDSVQGSEHQFVILSCVKDIGAFALDQRRLLTAVTRDKAGIVVVSSSEFLGRTPVMRALVRACNDDDPSNERQ
eukprot:6481920-Amphidinium_carterae.1